MENSRPEQAAANDIAQGAAGMVDWLADLVAFDTTTRETFEVHRAAREQAKLQQISPSASRPWAPKAELWEPSTKDVADCRHVRDGRTFDGYTKRLVKVPAGSTGRNLLFNGHIDVVSGEPFDAWKSHPFTADVRDARVHVRGTVDLKGGGAAMVFAAEVLARHGVALSGDLIINTVTNEESTGAGSVADGSGADAVFTTEPTSLNLGVGCRGSILPTVTVPGRTGHAAATPPHWQARGAVSAAEKSALIIETRHSVRHSLLVRPRIVHPRWRPDRDLRTKSGPRRACRRRVRAGGRTGGLHRGLGNNGHAVRWPCRLARRK